MKSGPSKLGASVVVCTYNRPDHLVTTVQDLLDQDFRPLQILVVDQSDNANTAVTGLDQTTGIQLDYYHVKFRGLPLARNFGWQRAVNEVVIYVDDDIRCENGFVTHHLSAYENSDVFAVAGGISEANDDPDFHGKIGHFSFWTGRPTTGFHLSGAQRVLHAKGANFSLRKSVLEKIGGFDEGLTKGAALYEELEMFLRARKQNLKVWFEPMAHVHHLAAPAGGCRVPDINKYIWSLSRNQAVVFSRHLRWMHLPSAHLRWLLLVASYARAYKSPKLFLQAYSGWLEGWQQGRREPICSQY